MHEVPLYQGIVLLLTQCGVTSLRMFLPSLLYLLLLRFHGVLGDRCPEMVRELAAATPAWMLHDATLWTLGALAVLEYVALHNDETREFLTGHFDRCAKAVFAFLATYSFLTAEEAAQVRDLLPQLGDAGEPLRAAGVAVGMAGAVALGAGGVTYGLATLRQRILEFVRALDPDDSLRLNSLAARAE
ncbi:MAG: hypothetical protein J6333_11945, partial [Planctomycetes bacterium]|nr:hypothetical protein [Planctomycetota bacterium]